jgi:hypothetical protein
MCGGNHEKWSEVRWKEINFSEDVRVT